jgi:hypothetical protein
MGVSDGVEGLMDDEAKKISEMADAELEARWAAGEPAPIRKREDFAQRMFRVVQQTAEKSEGDSVDVETLRVDTTGWFAPENATPTTERVRNAATV